MTAHLGTAFELSELTRHLYGLREFALVRPECTLWSNGTVQLAQLQDL